ncbi:sensor histidine kinase [Asaia krungthepensis]|uniref:histidine kinase n=1 Tax=Asaia krungthepensis NRIC 0535 TaxID=1307925 RepID=A0ABQ0PZB4_9PROT|nr:HAMP domain-containing sensor histidine kinase [Asaia krungthepensis]GBQ85316.1 two component sensor histidine kinase [Asaia krungthepensis NRIC 0535]
MSLTDTSRFGVLRTATFRLTLAFVAAIIGGMVLQFVLLFVQMTHFESERSSGILHREADVLVQETPERLEYQVRERASNELRVVINWVGLFDGHYHHIAGDLKAWPEGLTVDGKVHRLTLSPTDDAPYEMRFLAVKVPGGRILVLAHSLHLLSELHYMIRRGALLSVFPVVMFALLTGVVLSHRALARVKTMHEAIDRIMQGDVHERLPAGRERDELERLAGSVNRMLDRLEHLMDEIRDVGNDIAHDLRTPLSRVRARLERATSSPHDADYLNSVIEQATQDLDQCFSVITALLRIGEIENGRRRAGFAYVNLGDLVADIVDLYEPIAETNGLVLTSLVVAEPASDTLVTFGDRDLLVEVLANLLDNAMKFTPPGGHVTVSATPGPSVINLRVADTGIGIPEAEREAVLGRFYRSDKSRHVPGSGLGLSLVMAILRLHGVELAIADGDGTTAAKGCAFEMTFQVSGSPDPA